MGGPEFYQTMMGRRFFEGQLPALIKALNRIADAMESKEPDCQTCGRPMGVDDTSDGVECIPCESKDGRAPSGLSDDELVWCDGSPSHGHTPHSIEGEQYLSGKGCVHCVVEGPDPNLPIPYFEVGISGDTIYVRPEKGVPDNLRTYILNTLIARYKGLKLSNARVDQIRTEVAVILTALVEQDRIHRSLRRTDRIWVFEE